MTKTAFIRPAWTPVTITLMVLGFMVYWPLGLLVIAYIMWGDRLDGLTSDLNRGVDRVFSGCRRARGSTFSPTGNVAFDEWREAELKRLDEERRKLDGMRAEFDDYARELRRAKDRDEFDRFMARRRAGKPDIKSDLETA